MASTTLLNPPFSLSSPSACLFPFSKPFELFSLTKQSGKKVTHSICLCTSYEVGNGYPEPDFAVNGRKSDANDQFNEKLDSSQYEAILKGGEQVTSVLQEMITIVSLFSPFLYSYS